MVCPQNVCNSDGLHWECTRGTGIFIYCGLSIGFCVFSVCGCASIDSIYISAKWALGKAQREAGCVLGTSVSDLKEKRSLM